ncbi:MAG TPA: biotin--[acetyl-CoA-carboxylase] ligase [Propionicimonas sp.]|nr:biotin--[acetyl-CoA-carboxylase] ligase [Propionicimonas sp.]
MDSGVDAGALAQRLSGGLWSRIETVATTGSTNADLAAAARAGAPSGSVLVAEHQGRGRGRFARVWEAPPGTSVAISVLLRPEGVEPRRLLWLPLLAGLAVTEALAGLGAPAAVKWPNDVLIEGRKVCGILSERVDVGAVVIGMGINTTLAQADLPVPTATSLALAGYPAATIDVVAGVLRALGGWYLRWLAGEDLREAYRAASATIGRGVRVEVSPTESVTGEAVGVDADGCLLVRTPAGVRGFAAGDVWHLR